MYKLDSSNLRVWNPDADNLELALGSHEKHLLPGRTQEDLLYEILLKQGIELTEDARIRELGGKRVYSLGHGQYYACMETVIPSDQIESLALGIVQWKMRNLRTIPSVPFCDRRGVPVRCRQIEFRQNTGTARHSFRQGAVIGIPSLVMNVKLHFESHLDYQLEAIDAVCDLFKGQESTSQSAFTVCGGLSLEPQIWDSSRGQMIQQGYLSSIGQEEGIGNRLCLVESELLDNLHQVQERNGLPSSESLGELDFTVEMETGTGKTYVYLRTILS